MKSKITYDDWLIVSNKLKNIKDVDLEQIRKLDILFAYLNQTEQGQQSSFLAEEQSQEVKNFIEKISKNEGYLTLSLLRDYVSKGEKGAVYLKAFVDRMNSNNTEQSYYFKPSGPTKELKTISMAGYRAGLNTFKEKYYAKYRGQLMMDLVNDPALQAAEKGSREYAFKRKEMESVYRLGGDKDKNLPPKFILSILERFKTQAPDLKNWSYLIGRGAVVIENKVYYGSELIETLENMEKILDDVTAGKWRIQGLPDLESLNVPELININNSQKLEQYKKALYAFQYYFQYCATPDGIQSLSKWAKEGLSEMAGGLFIFKPSRDTFVTLDIVSHSYDDLIGAGISGRRCRSGYFF
jgi:hypothetical protein